MVRRCKTWREKLEGVKEPRIVDDPRGRGRMLIPKPLDIENLIRGVPCGGLVTVNQIRENLARRFGVDLTCPLVTGLFIRIIAEAAEEDRRGGRTDITPYWRVIKVDGSLNPKFPGGVEAQAERLRAEGHTIIEGKGGKLFVKDFETHLVRLP